MKHLKPYNYFLSALLSFTFIFGVIAQSVSAQRAEQTPEELIDVEIEEHLNAALPLNLEFKNERDQTVKLKNYFGNDKPVILTLVYFRCPMLCGLLLNGMLEGLKELKMSAGEEFEIVTLSFDPLETPALAQRKKQSMLKEYGRAGADKGWHFLTGRENNIKRLTETIGFKYTFVEERNEYAHAAAIFVCTPDGRISRYLYGIQYDHQTLRLSLVEASNGNIGNTLDQIMLYCYHYDPDSRRYAPVAMNIMRAGGILTVIILGTVLTVFWVRESRRKKAIVEENGEKQVNS